MSKHTNKEIKQKNIFKRIKSEIKVTHWPTPKEAFRELGVVSIISCVIMGLVLFMDMGWGFLISLIY